MHSTYNRPRNPCCSPVARRLKPGQSEYKTVKKAANHQVMCSLGLEPTNGTPNSGRLAHTLLRNWNLAEKTPIISCLLAGCTAAHHPQAHAATPWFPLFIYCSLPKSDTCPSNREIKKKRVRTSVPPDQADEMVHLTHGRHHGDEMSKLPYFCKKVRKPTISCSLTCARRIDAGT